MKQAEKTNFTFCTDIFRGKYLNIKSDGKVVIKIDYVKNDPDRKVIIEMDRMGDVSSYTLWPDDSFILHHHVKVEATKDIQKDHVFPITFKMDGQEYKLNRTKQNKLILTK